MDFTERSFSGRLFRPKPEVYFEPDMSFGAIVTPWGQRAAARKVIDALKDYVLSARQDMEATSPFQKLTCLSPLANNLRVGVMLANDVLYREDNKSEYACGVEVLVFAQQQGELAFAQVGCPHFFLARQGLPWIPLSTQIDLGLEYSQGSAVQAPLPQNLIGLHNTTNMNVSSVKTLPGDRLILLSHSLAASPLFQLSFDDAALDAISARLAKDHPDLPFWLGVFGLK